MFGSYNPVVVEKEKHIEMLIVHRYKWQQM